MSLWSCSFFDFSAQFNENHPLFLSSCKRVCNNRDPFWCQYYWNLSKVNIDLQTYLKILWSDHMYFHSIRWSTIRHMSVLIFHWDWLNVFRGRHTYLHCNLRTQSKCWWNLQANYDHFYFDFYSSWPTICKIALNGLNVD